MVHYLNSLLQSIHDACPNMIEPHVLNTVLPALLLALVARNTNIILATHQIGDLQRSTNKILTTVFGLQTKRVKIRSPQSPRDLLVSLFFSFSPASSPSPSHTRKSARTSIPRSVSAPHPSSSHFTECSDSIVTPPASGLAPRTVDPLLSDSESQSNLRLPQVVAISGLEHAGRAAQLALAEVLRTRRIVLASHDQQRAVWNLPEAFFVIYVSPVGDGRERPAIHTALLDHFAFSITVTQAFAPTSTAPPSPRPLPHPLSSSSQKHPLLPRDCLPHADTTNLSPLVSHYTNAIVTAARHHPELDGMFLTARCVKDTENLIRASGVIFREEEDDVTITEAHVRRVVPPVLAHRLRVRDSPREQIMGVLWEGAGVDKWGEPPAEMRDERRTVSAILAEILAEV